MLAFRVRTADDGGMRGSSDGGRPRHRDIEDDEGQPRPRTRKLTAKDGVISTVDPDARHGHRSRSDRYDDYKLHVSADVDSDLTCAAKATLATMPWSCRA